MSDGNCVIGSREHPATDGHLCRPHYERVAQWLHEIEVEAAILSPVKSMQIASGNRGSGLASHRSPVRLDALVMLDRRRGTGIPVTGEPDPWGFDETPSILDVLGSWARMTREERGLTPPDRATVASERRTLTAQLDWICEQPWVDEFVAELRTLRLQLKAVNGTQDDKPYGRCYLPDEDGLCNGPIWLDTAAGHAHCGKCRQTWDGDQVARLKFAQDQERAEAARPHTEDGRPMRTAQEIADDLGTSLNAVRLRLSRAGAKAVGSYYDPTWLERASA